MKRCKNLNQKLLPQWLKDTNITRRQIAKLAKCSPSSLTRIINHKGVLPNLKTAYIISELSDDHISIQGWFIKA